MWYLDLTPLKIIRLVFLFFFMPMHFVLYPNILITLTRFYWLYIYHLFLILIYIYVYDLIKNFKCDDFYFLLNSKYSLKVKLYLIILSHLFLIFYFNCP